MAIVRYTREQLENMTGNTDWEYLRNMKDEDIDTSDPDAPYLGDLIEKGLVYEVPNPMREMWLKERFA